MVSKFKQLFIFTLLFCPFTVLATGNWHFGIAGGITRISNEPGTGGGSAQITIGTATTSPAEIYFGASNDTDATLAPVMEFFAVNSNAPSWTYIIGLLPAVNSAYYTGVTASYFNSATVTIDAPYSFNADDFVSGPGLSQNHELINTMLELGAAYDLFHTDNGWFFDIAVRAGLFIGGDKSKTVANTTINIDDGSNQAQSFDVAYTLHSHLADGYQKLELGLGKTIGNYLFRASVSQVMYNSDNQATITSVPFGDPTTRSVSPGESMNLQLALSYWW
ncbi:MAG: hypothetical protein OEY11_13680 [Gammaproteobacteria bacterium]|nr:hypothetical protein [Gammaproteobacteria bacterium]